VSEEAKKKKRELPVMPWLHKINALLNGELLEKVCQRINSIHADLVKEIRKDSPELSPAESRRLSRKILSIAVGREDYREDGIAISIRIDKQTRAK